MPDETWNTPFNDGELRLIAEKIDELKASVRGTGELTEAGLRALDAKLEEVKEAARSGIGRIHWWDQLVGAIVNLFLAQVIPPQLAQSLIALAVPGLTGLYGAAPPSGLPQGVSLAGSTTNTANFSGLSSSSSSSLTTRRFGWSPRT